MFEELKANDRQLFKNNIHRIFAPAGLDIGCVTLEDIALSIVAEVQSHFSKKNGMPLKLTM